MDQILGRFNNYSDNPLQDIGFESVKGRSFRIQGSNQVDTLIVNMEKTMVRFDAVSERCKAMERRIDSRQRTFFHDNLAVPADYMAHLSHALYHFMLAYKQQDDKVSLRRNIQASLDHLKTAKADLYSTHHGVFSTWYTNDRLWGFDGKLKALQRILDENT